MILFDFYNVTLEKTEDNRILVRGEITNRSGKPIAAAAIRVMLFVRSICIANAVVTVNGLPMSATKTFQRTFDDLEYDKIAHEITKYEIYTDSAY